MDALPPIPISAAMAARMKREEERKRRIAGCCAAIRAYLVANLKPDTKELRFDATGDFWCSGLRYSDEFDKLRCQFAKEGGWSIAWRDNVQNAPVKRVFYVTPIVDE